MKKYLSLVLISSLLLLSGCITIQNPPNETGQGNSQTPNNPANKGELTQTEFITQTFATYGYTTPDPSMWLVKQEGPKTVVIIKEFQGQGRPNISKLIFSWNGSSAKAQVWFVMINNRPAYGADDSLSSATSGATPYLDSANVALTMEEAEIIFLKQCPDGVTIIQRKLNFDDGRYVYKFEAHQGGYEYEGKIDANTGNILKFEIDD